MRGKQVQQMARKFIRSVRTIYPIVGTQEHTLTCQSVILFLVRMRFGLFFSDKFVYWSKML